jgi:hypothetical protein
VELVVETLGKHSFIKFDFIHSFPGKASSSCAPSAGKHLELFTKERE